MIHELALIPGLNTNARLFDPVVAALPPDIHGIALDNPALDSVEDIAKAHLAVLPRRFWLAGFAFGGYVALAMREHAPKRVLGLALVCSGPGEDTPVQSEVRKRTITHARAGGHLDMVRAQAEHAFHPDHLADQALMKLRMDMAAEYGSERFIAHQHACANRTGRRFVLDGRVPMLLVAGSHDKVYPPEAMRELAASVPGCEFRAIERSGHMVPMEQPLALARRFALWIGANRTAKPPDSAY
jgi:pimeloyl-ACP methyl ester carboxylesterase